MSQLPMVLKIKQKYTDFAHLTILKDLETIYGFKAKEFESEQKLHFHFILSTPQ